MSMNNSRDTIGNRTRDLPDFSTVPQPTAPPRNPNINYYQEYFLGGKGGRCVGLTTLPPSFTSCLKSGSLNLLEPSGPVQASNGTALSLPLPLNHG
jgi:hypothetical protein